MEILGQNQAKIKITIGGALADPALRYV